MGKHMREAKIAGDVAVMELSQSTIGVRTRARTLELQRRQSSAPPPPPSNPDPSYLQLRSRRLPALLASPEKSPRRNKKYGSRQRCVPQDPGSRNSDAHSSSRVRVSSGCSVGSGGYDLGIEASSYGEHIQPRDHGLAREGDEVIHSAMGESLVNLPSRGEMDEFFTHSEQQQQSFFVDKYNYDIANDLPLPGRFDWVRVSQ